MNRPSTRWETARTASASTIHGSQYVAAPIVQLDDDLILEGDNLPLLPPLPAGAFALVYAAPPFNTGRRRFRVAGGGPSYADDFTDYPAFLRPRLLEIRRLL